MILKYFYILKVLLVMDKPNPLLDLDRIPVSFGKGTMVSPDLILVVGPTLEKNSVMDAKIYCVVD